MQMECFGLLCMMDGRSVNAEWSFKNLYTIMLYSLNLLFARLRKSYFQIGLI